MSIRLEDLPPALQEQAKAKIESQSKYHAKKTAVDGIVFDSVKESKRYAELSLLQRAGAIVDLRLQPRYLLQESFKCNGKTIRKIEYVADFQYGYNGKTIIEDVKGMKTPVYLLKKKMFLYKNKDKLETGVWEFKEI